MAPEASQQAVLAAAQRAEQQGWAAAQAETSKLVATLAENGMQVSESAPAEVESGFETIGATMAAEWLQRTGDEGKAIIDAYRK